MVAIAVRTEQDAPRGQLARDAGLRRQHRAWTREGYDGHNRRSGLTSMNRLRERRRRRLMHRFVLLWLRAYR